MNAEAKPLIGYCVLCKVDREIANQEILRMPTKEGGEEEVIKGTCRVCGTSIYSIPS